MADVIDVNDWRSQDREAKVRTPTEKVRAGLLDTSRLKQIPPPEPIVDGLLFANTLAMLFGASGVGKSFVALDIALHVAAGAWWHRREVRAKPVLYVVAEGGMGFARRIEAWERHNGLRADKLPVHWYPYALNVYELTWAAALAEVVGEIRPGLVVIDTLARCAFGAEENSAKDVGRVVAHLDLIRRAAGSCVWLIHHSGKNAEAGARGSTALKGAMDTELEAVGDSRSFLLCTRKQKDAPEANPISLGLRQVVGTSSVAVATPATNARTEAGRVHCAQTYAALVDIDVPGGNSTAAWRMATGLNERTFYRNRKVLLDEGHVINVGSIAQPRYRPKRAVVAEGDGEC